MASEFVESRIAPEVERFLRSARAGDATECKALLEKNPDLIDAVEGGGFAALHFAAFDGDIRLLETLVAFHPNLNIKNYDGNTPLMLAAKMAQEDAVRLLVKAGADVNFSSDSGITAAHHAAAMGRISTLHLLVSLGADASGGAPRPVGSVLHWACHSGEVAVIGTCLYDLSIDINTKDAHGGTPLFVACHAKKSDVVLFLLEQGADPNAAAADKSTPLHIAAEFGTVDDVQNLIAFGADPNAVTAEGGLTPLAIAEKAGNRESARELSKPIVPRAKRLDDAGRFKEHGNKVFSEGENVKASRFYTLAIANNPQNHIYFSNRSACYFNTKQYTAALFDAKRCIALAPSWPKGFLRLGATLNALKRFDEAREAIRKGLAIDPNNVDLKALLEEIGNR